MNTEVSKQKTWGLITGYSLVLMAIVAGFTIGYVHETIYMPNDAASTHAALEANIVLFQSGIATWILIAILDVVVSIGIYKIYRNTSVNWATLVALLRLIYTAVLVLAIAQLIIPLASAEMKNALVYFESFHKIWSYGLIIFGIHLVTLCLIGWKSDFTPKLISVFLFLGGLSYILIESSNLFFAKHHFISPSVETIFAILMASGELIFAVWLIVRYTRLKSNNISS